MKNQFMKVGEEVLVVKVCQAFSCKNYNIKSETGQYTICFHVGSYQARMFRFQNNYENGAPNTE